jgi:hypothetical protein
VLSLNGSSLIPDASFYMPEAPRPFLTIDVTTPTTRPEVDLRIESYLDSWETARFIIILTLLGLDSEPDRPQLLRAEGRMEGAPYSSVAEEYKDAKVVLDFVDISATGVRRPHVGVVCSPHNSRS